MIWVVLFTFTLQAFIPTNDANAVVRASSDTSDDGCPANWVKHDVSVDLHVCQKTQSSSSLPQTLLLLGGLYKWLDAKTQNTDYEMQNTAYRTQIYESQRQLETSRQQLTACNTVYCPQGWLPYKEKCFLLVNASAPFTFSEARQLCNQLNPRATLLTIHSAEEEKEVINLVVDKWNVTYFEPFQGQHRDGDGVWLDGTSVNGQSFYWNDGTHVTYNRWQRNKYTNNATSNVHLHIAPSLLYSLWFDSRPDTRQIAVCEMYAMKTSFELSWFGGNPYFSDPAAG